VVGAAFPLTDRQIAFMRRVQARTRRDSCQVQKVQSSSDNAGGTTDEWVNDGEPIPCRLSPDYTPEREQMADGRLVALSSWIVAVAHDVTIPPDRRLLVTSRSRGTYTLDVVGDRKDKEQLADDAAPARSRSRGRAYVATGGVTLTDADLVQAERLEHVPTCSSNRLTTFDTHKADGTPLHVVRCVDCGAMVEQEA
jgi:hypothetical protein